MSKSNWSAFLRASVLAALLALGGVYSAAAAKTISFWTQNATTPAVLEALERFTAETGIEVDLKAISWGTEELLVAHVAGAAPDVWTHGGAALGALAEQGLMSPIDDWADRWVFAGDVAPQAYEVNRYKGQLVAMPWRGIAVGGMPYRVDFFLEAGLDPNAPPETWDELVEYGRRLVRRDENGAVLRSGFNVTNGSWDPSFWFRLFTLQAGIDVFRDATHSLTDPRIAQAVEFYVDLYLTHRLNDPGFGGSVATGTAAMGAHPLGGGVLNLIDQHLQAGGDIDNIRMSIYPHLGTPRAVLTGDFIAISSGTPNRTEALALLEYLIAPEQHEPFTQVFGGIPIYRQAAGWDWVAARPQVHTLMQIMFEYGAASAPHPRFFELRQVQNDVMLAALSGSQAPQVVLDQYASEYRIAWHGE